MRLACAAAAFACFVAFAADGKAPAPKKPGVQVPLGLLPLEFPPGNPFTPEKAELGRVLYFDKRLSKDNTISWGRAIRRSTATPMALRIRRASTTSTEGAARPAS